MISKDMAKKQVSRLGGMFGFPIGMREAIEELILATQCADTELIAARAIGSFLETADSDTRCPMPKQIREAINAIQEPAYAPVKPPEPVCHDCDDSGIVGGLLGGPAAEWCMCAASTEAKRNNPNAVTETNEVWAKLAVTFGKKASARQLLADAQRKRHAVENVTRILTSIDGARQ